MTSKVCKPALTSTLKLQTTDKLLEMQSVEMLDKIKSVLVDMRNLGHYCMIDALHDTPGMIDAVKSLDLFIAEILMVYEGELHDAELAKKRH